MLTAAPTKSLETFFGWYIQSARQSAEASLSNLNGSVNWALTITLAIAAFVMQFIMRTDPVKPSDALFSLGILSITLSVIAHFGIRTAKNYINLIRFAALERKGLEAQILHVNASSSPQDYNERLSQLLNTIREYHIEWKSPVSKKKIFIKILFEFGFSYLILFLSAIYIYIATFIPIGQYPFVYLFVFAVAIALLIELLIFSNSPYVRFISIDEIAERLG